MKPLRFLSTLLTCTLVAAAVHAATYDHLGIQMWSLRENTKANGFISSLDIVKGWGIPEIEGGLVTEGLTNEQVVAAIKERGLKMPSAHVGYETLGDRLDEMVANAKALGVKYAICPWIPHQGEFNRENVQNAAATFNRAGAAFRAAGIKFGYHPHGYEFVPTANGETLLDDLIRACNSGDVCFQMDVFWVYHGGGDPVALLNKYAGRWMGLHVKDIRKGADHGKPLGHAPVEDNVAVGLGQIDWMAVLPTAKKVGADYFIIEDETSDPLKNVPLTLDYLREFQFPATPSS